MMVDTILRAYHAATPRDVSEGLGWYAAAHNVALHMADVTGITVQSAAATLAALSPRVGWEPNVRAAWRMAYAASAGHDQPVVAGLPGNRDKAWRVLHGEHPDAVLGGRKVRAFYRAIMGDPDAVVVDVWAARAAGHNVDTITPTLYRDIEQAYREAAAIIGCEARQFQAVVWTAYRRANMAHYAPRQQWLLKGDQ